MTDHPGRRFPTLLLASFATLLLASLATLLLVPALAVAQQLPPDVLERVAGTADALSPLAVLAPLGISPFLALGLLGAGAQYTELVLPSNLAFVGHPTLWVGLLSLAVLLHVGRSFKLSKPLVELLGTSESMVALVALAAMFVTPDVAASEGSGVALEASPLGTALMVAGAVSGLVVVIVVRMGFDLLTWLSPIPFVDALLQLGKTVATVALVAVAVFAPVLAVVLNLALLVAAVLAGRWLLRVARFGTRLLWDASVGRFGYAPVPVADGRIGPFPAFALGNDCRLPWLGLVEVTWEDRGWRAQGPGREGAHLGASGECGLRRGLMGTVLTTPRARLVVTARYHRELRRLAELTGTPLAPRVPMDGDVAEARPAPPALLAILLGAVLAAGCATAPAIGESEAATTDPSAQVVRSGGGAVAAASVLATEVGARVLAEGGNAVDAAVATGFALAVAEPSMSGLGGRASMVVWTPEGELFGIDGLNQVPGGYREGSDLPSGYDRAAIPGVPAALLRAHAEHGSWPLPRVMEGAIRLAEEGFPLPADEAARWAGAADELAAYPSSRATFLRSDGTPWEAGDRFRNPALARTLRAIAEGGADAFYRGWIADSIHVQMERAGGFLTRDELAAYEALDALLVEGTYRGHRLVSNFRPSSGHAVIQALQTMEEVGPAPGRVETARWGAVVGQAMHWALEDRGRRFGSETGSARRLTSRAHARERAERIRIVEREDGLDRSDGPDRSDGLDRSDGSRAPEHVWRLESAIPGVSDRSAAADVPIGALVVAPSDREATTAMAATDARGMTVSLTQSNGPSLGTRLVASGLGFVYATRLGSEAGSRPSSTISPTLVFDPDGSLAFALGGAGDSRIITAVIQVISRVVDHGMSLEEAVAAPRVHPTDSLELRVEEGPVGMWSEAERARLRAWGFELEAAPSGYFGRVHAVAPAPAGEASGVAEPRWTGGAAGPRQR